VVWELGVIGNIELKLATHDKLFAITRKRYKIDAQFCEKMVKVGPINTEIIGLHLKKNPQAKYII